MIASTAVSDYSFSLSLNAVHDHARVVNDCLHTLQVFVAPGQVTQLVAFDFQEPGTRSREAFRRFTERLTALVTSEEVSPPRGADHQSHIEADKSLRDDGW